MESNRHPNTVALVATAIAALVAHAAQAQVHPEKPTYKYEKCYGVVKAGKNDCFTSRSACAGTAASDQQPDAWVYLPKGTCDRIVGGSVAPIKQKP